MAMSDVGTETTVMGTETLRDRISAALVSEVVVDDSKLDRVRYPDVEKARAAYIATERNRRVARLRASAAPDVFATHRGKNERGELSVRAYGGGEVVFASVNFVEMEDGNTCVEVRSPGSGETHFRIVNPPTLARDPLGDIEINGVKYREDPLAAIAEVIAGNRQSQKRRTR